MATVNENLVVSAESPHDDECQKLMAQLLAELSEKYPDELINMPLVPEDLTVLGAISLNESAGYQRATSYEPFRDNPMSVCFEKELNYRTGGGSDLAVTTDSTP